MHKLRTTLVGAAALAAIACSGDKDPLGVNSGDALTEAELQMVFLQIADAFDYVGSDQASPSPARATVQLSESVGGTAPCASGGTIAANGSANGTVDDEPFEVDVTYHLRMTPNGCVVETETGSITLEGAPYIQLDMDFYLTDTVIEISGTEEGGIAFTSSDGRSGSCAFDVSFTGNMDLEANSGTSTVSGTVCGVSAENLTVFELS